ncbi:MAG: hypothetical protein GX335_10610, partial [Firmicutes bacterium]|nr:hypothetical protein [Bacillota bacterium]
DLIATTFLDVDELQTLIKLPHIPTLGIVLELELETVVRVARLAQNSILAVVCSTDAFATTVKQSFCKSGIDNLDFIFTTASGEQLAKIIAQCDAVAVSAERTTEMLGWIQEGVQIEIIKLKYRIDQGSLNMLRCYLADLRNQT